jgi:hyperosmotically inducible periplasmic protein
MSSKISKSHRLLVPVGGLVLGISMMGMPTVASPNPPQSAPDNTQQNKDQQSPNADQQGMNSSDRAITQKIRKAIHEDKSLSTYAQNIKVITRDGKVTLRGPVRSDDEKSNLQAKAAAVVSEANVTNNLEVAPAK